MIFEGHFTLPSPISQKLYRIRPQKLKFIIRNQTSAFRWYECRWPWRYFKVIKLFHIQFLINGALYGRSYSKVLIGNHALAFDWCHFWWPWSTFEGHFSLVCHVHVHYSNPWHAFASRGFPAIAELLVSVSVCLGISALCAWVFGDEYLKKRLDRGRVTYTAGTVNSVPRKSVENVVGYLITAALQIFWRLLRM